MCVQDIGWSRVNVGAGRVWGATENSQCHQEGMCVLLPAVGQELTFLTNHYTQSLSAFSKECVYRVSSSLLGV